MPRDWQLRLQDILEAIEKILRYTEEMDFDEFKQDEKTIDAVIRNFTVLGEAAAHVPEEVEKRYPELPWAEMRGMRHILIHEYFGVSLPIVWETIRNDLPPLVPKLKTLIEQESQTEGQGRSNKRVERDTS